MDNRPENPALFLAVYLLFAPVIWFAVGFVLATVSGWQALGKRFRCTLTWTGKLWRFQSADMRLWPFGSYHNCLNFGICAEGIYVAPILFFRMGHPPLLIPWQEITVFQEPVGFPFKRKRLILGRDFQIPLLVSKDLAMELKESAGDMWPSGVAI